MSTYTQICYHIVFSTKDRAPALEVDGREQLFRYIWGIVKNRKSHLYRINGTADHVHILTSLHPTSNLAEYETEKAGVRVVAPMMAIETVAAGGGSICRFDGVKLTVGPDRAGPIRARCAMDGADRSR